MNFEHFTATGSRGKFEATLVRGLMSEQVTKYTTDGSLPIVSANDCHEVYGISATAELEHSILVLLQAQSHGIRTLMPQWHCTTSLAGS